MASGAPDYTKPVLLVGRDESGQLVVVRLDDAGRMEAVMKGDYQGTLRTIAVDEDGKIAIQAFDPLNVFGDDVTIGNAELAARLFSPVVYERRGTVIFLTDLSWGLAPFTDVAPPSGGSLGVVPECCTGGYSAKFTFPSGSGQDESTLGIRLGFRSIQKRYGLEVCFKFNDLIEYVLLSLWVYHEGKEYAFAAAYDYVGKILQVGHPEGSLTTIDHDVVLPYRTWHRMKMVVDPSNQRHLRLYVDNLQYDTSGVTVGAVSTDEEDRMEGHFVVANQTDKAAEAWLDSMVITVDEPET